MENQVTPIKQPNQFSRNITILVVFLLALATIYFLRANNTTVGAPVLTDKPLSAKQALTSPTPTSANASKPQDLIGSSSIMVNNQMAGGQVVVAKLTMENAGWVVVHDQRKGQPGLIIAAARFNAGTYANRIVDLLGSETKPGIIYYAVLNNDNGDRLFDYTKDLPLKDTLGNMIMAKFSTFNATSTKQ